MGKYKNLIYKKINFKDVIKFYKEIIYLIEAIYILIIKIFIQLDINITKWINIIIFNLIFKILNGK